MNEKKFGWTNDLIDRPYDLEEREVLNEQAVTSIRESLIKLFPKKDVIVWLDKFRKLARDTDERIDEALKDEVIRGNYNYNGSFFSLKDGEQGKRKIRMCRILDGAEILRTIEYLITAMARQRRPDRSSPKVSATIEQLTEIFERQREGLETTKKELELFREVEDPN